MSSKEPEAMTDAEVAEQQYDAYDAGELDDEDGEPAEFEVARPLVATMSFRVPREEADAIRTAAAEAGLSQSGWIRAAARTAINHDLIQPILPPVTASKLQAIKDLVDAVLVDTRTPGVASEESVEVSMAQLLAAVAQSITAVSSQRAVSPSEPPGRPSRAAS